MGNGIIKNERTWKGFHKAVFPSNHRAAAGYGLYEVKQYIEPRIDFSRFNADSKVAVVNDLDFAIADVFVSHGIKNITLIETSKKHYETALRVWRNWRWRTELFNDAYLDNLPWKKIVYLDVNKNKYKIEGDIDMHYDIVIANFPYGKSGSLANKLTQVFFDTPGLTFDDFLTVCPTSTFGYSNKLFQHIKECYGKIEENAFAESGADTHPCVCKLMTGTNNFDSYADFHIAYIIQPIWRKFFQEQLVRMKNNPAWLEHKYDINGATYEGANIETDFITGICTNINGVHTLDLAPGEKLWNIKKSEPVLSRAFPLRPGCKEVDLTLTRFDAPEKKTNFAQWWNGPELAGRDPKSGLASKIMYAYNYNAAGPYAICIPCVDWSHPWTDEEILRDYGYTDEEISILLN